jgi:NAD(P)-dependent dehydrogenase (short-subunit alcohol dehydrogenase family)
MKELRFDQNVAVITGAGRGLGRAYALLLASLGAKIVVNDPGVSLKGEGTDAGPAEQVAQEIRAAGGDAIACTASVATPEGGQAIIQAALDHYGRLDILIHNAGIVRANLLSDMTYDEFDSVLSVHLRGGFYITKPAFTHMKNAGYGRIVLTSSIGGIYGSPAQANYGAAKAGLLGLTNVVALEGAAHNVKCNAIVPGAVTRMAEGIDTSAYPPMTSEMVAPVVGWLCHENCTINGEYLISIAGRVARLYYSETQGVFSDNWTIPEIDAQIGAIRDNKDPYISAGHGDHIRYSCAMAAKARAV